MSMFNVLFNKPYFTGKETKYIRKAVSLGKISGDGYFTHKCQEYFQNRYGFKRTLLTTSCTDALEMCALLINTQPGDEIIAPSYTFVSSVNAFVLRGAKIVFSDSHRDNPNIDPNKLELLITPKTKAIVVVHYAGIACDMDTVLKIAEKHHLYVIEDAAHSIDAYFKDKPLGSLGHLAAFSFHETKNIISGEGGMLVINDPSFAKRAEIIREKGTNRAEFYRGEVNKYGWVDIGSSFLPSDIIAAFLYAQIENLEKIQFKRMAIWNRYYEGLKCLEDSRCIKLPYVPSYAIHNAHLFYIICRSLEERTLLINFLQANNIASVFHYLPLHISQYYGSLYKGKKLKNAEKYADCLLRLPMYYELSTRKQNYVIHKIIEFFTSK